jgi:hypothetical protein
MQTKSNRRERSSKVIFDSLPPEIRKAVNESPVRYIFTKRARALYDADQAHAGHAEGEAMSDQDNLRPIKPPKEKALERAGTNWVESD